MKVLFAGYGSIAKRHIKNLRLIANDRCIDLEIDLLRHTSAAAIDGIHAVYANLEELSSNYDAVFITNPTALHYKTLKVLQNYGKAFFLEKPAFDSEAYDLSPFEEKLIYVACPLRYTAVIQWLHENFDFKKVISARAISSSYLPEWRPGTDYRNTYSAYREMGGGVSIDLIHEWDYLQYLLGFPNKVHSFITKKSNLEINSDDIAIYIAEYEDKTIELHLDYFGRVPIRRLELFTEDDTVVCDLLASSITCLKSCRTLHFDEVRDDYQIKEMKHFLDISEGKVDNTNPLEMAVRTIRLTKGLL